MLKNSSLRKNFTDLRYLTARHIKLYFKDKQTFFMSLITPLILVVLFATFLRSVYVSSLLSVLPEGVVLPDKLVNGFVGGWLISSILGTTSVTLAFLFCRRLWFPTRRISALRISTSRPSGPRSSLRAILSPLSFPPFSFALSVLHWDFSILPSAAGIFPHWTFC